jgi:uncharacterized protein (TIGR02453 family)
VRKVNGFQGYPEEGLSFLKSLAKNNNRDWFNKRKEIFQNCVQKPTQDFVFVLGQRLHSLSPQLVYDTGLDGRGSIMRIYRDLRFSKDKSPYKKYVGITFWEGLSKKDSISGFFIRMESTGAEVYAGKHVFGKSDLQSYREAVLDEELGTELEKHIELINNLEGYEVGGLHYKRVPLGYDKDHERRDLLRHNGLWARAPRIEAEVLTGPEFVEVCYEHCAQMAPIHRWLVKLSQFGGR